MFKIHIIFDSGFSLRSYPKAYLKILGRTLFSQNTYLLTQSSDLKMLHFHVPRLDFEKYFIFMFPRVENLANPLHFRFELFLRTYPKAYLKMVGRTQFRQKTLLLKQSSDFEKHFIFIFSMIAQISKKNSFSCYPEWKMLQFTSFSFGFSLRKAYLKILGWKTLKIHFIFRFELFLRTYLKAYLKMVGWKLLQVYFILIRAFLVELAQGISQNLGRTQFRWKTLKIHFIFRFELFLRTYPKAYLKISDFEKHFIFMFPRVENFENPLYFRISALPEKLTQGISENLGRKHNFSSRARISKNTSFPYPPWWKTLKIHIIVDSGFSLSSYPKAYLKMLGRTQFSQKV
ncbi:hypothetical protein E2320_000115 [Naja naja]|nr:hypothetical protein E2320_000115 [Naja naja]